MEFLPKALVNLQYARSFLSRLKPIESITQLVFVAFLNDLINEMNKRFVESDASVVMVNGMETVSCTVTISAKYMHLNAQKRRQIYRGTSKETALTIKSDVVVIKGRTDKYENLKNTGKQLKNFFLECVMNIEMKQWGLLVGKKNRSSLTQVAAESMARCMARGKTNPLRRFVFDFD